MGRGWQAGRTAEPRQGEQSQVGRGLQCEKNGDGGVQFAGRVEPGQDAGVYRLQSRQNQGGQRVAVRAKGYGAGQTVVGVAEVVGQENGCGGRQNG